ncbi:MAG: hypothetical protein V4642_12005 [Bacteroidota bacterium]
MTKEPKNIDFHTTGKQPSKEDFAKISEWIQKKKNDSLKSARKVKSL